MYIINVVPLVSIPKQNPQILSYYSSERAALFSLIEVPIGRTYYRGLVSEVKEVKDIKSVLRKSSSFQVKKAGSIIHPYRLIWEWQFRFAQWMSDYYWASLGLCIKRFIPGYLEKHPGLPYLSEDLTTSHEQVLWLFPDASFFQKIKLPVQFIRISSELSPKKEFQFFKTISSGDEKYIVGTKRSLFAPYPHIKEVHVFEEMDTSHKSWDQHPRYHAVEAAKHLASLHAAKVFYHSTLPSIASYHKKLPFTPLGQRGSMKKLTLVDLAGQNLQSPFSDSIKEVMHKSYKMDQKMILYVNRRGEGRFVLCRDCGFVFGCPQCDTPLVLHLKQKERASRTLLCHHCGYVTRAPSVCSKCGSYEVRIYGFGTQRIERELSVLFPKAVITRLDSDSVQGQGDKQKVLDIFFRGGNFLVATAMLFQTIPQRVHLVAALNPDTEMHIPDFTQHEKLFFNLWRLRAWAKSYYIQTYNPQNPLFRALEAGRWRVFYREEIRARKALNYPPFSSIIKLSFAQRSERRASEEAGLLKRKFAYLLRKVCASHAHQVLGPAPAFIFRLKGKCRYIILLKLARGDSACKQMFLSSLPPGWEVDVDPIDSL